MRAERPLREAGALIRARAGWAMVIASAAALWASRLPGAAELPGLPAFLSGIVLALFFARGAVAQEFRSGAALLWLQRPVRPWVLYGSRAAVLALLLLGCHLVVVAVLAAAGLFEPPTTRGALVGLALTDLSILAVGFGVAAAGPPLESLVAVLVVLALATVAPDAHLDPEAFGTLAPWLAAVRLPVLEIRAVTSWLDGAAGPPDPGELARPFLKPAVWLAAALVVVELRAGGLRNPARPNPRRREPPTPPRSPPPGGSPPR
mgnify:CR=1 FL=1